MQFLLMVYESERWPTMSSPERRQIAVDCDAWHRELASRGLGKAGVGLYPPVTAEVVRETSGKPVVTDGPFIESKEVFGGFELIECADRAEALAIAKTFPALRAGFAMEVRQIMSAGDIERMIAR